MRVICEKTPWARTEGIGEDGADEDAKYGGSPGMMQSTWTRTKSKRAVKLVEAVGDEGATTEHFNASDVIGDDVEEQRSVLGGLFLKLSIISLLNG